MKHSKRGSDGRFRGLRRELTRVEREYLAGWQLAAYVIAHPKPGDDMRRLAMGGIGGAVTLRDFPRDVYGKAWDAGRSDGYLAAFGFDA